MAVCQRTAWALVRSHLRELLSREDIVGNLMTRDRAERLSAYLFSEKVPYKAFMRMKLVGKYRDVSLPP